LPSRTPRTRNRRSFLFPLSTEVWVKTPFGFSFPTPCSGRPLKGASGGAGLWVHVPHLLGVYYQGLRLTPASLPVLPIRQATSLLSRCTATRPAFFSFPLDRCSSGCKLFPPLAVLFFSWLTVHFRALSSRSFVFLPSTRDWQCPEQSNCFFASAPPPPAREIICKRLPGSNLPFPPLTLLHVAFAGWPPPPS